MKFSKVAHFFYQIEFVSGRLDKTVLLAELLSQATPQEASIICYLSLGKLYPPYIGTQFQMAEKNLILTVADLLGFDPRVIKESLKKLGDIGLVIGQSVWASAADISIEDVYKKLQNLEKVSGTGAQEEKIKLLKELLLQTDSLSAKYILRIVLGKLRLGFSDMTIIDALSWMEVGSKALRKKIENSYNLCADIGKIANTLKLRGIQSVEAITIQVGIPIRPAAAERLPTARAIVEKIGSCIAQPKLDGFRLQLHLKKENSITTIKFFSRNLLDMTFMFPDIRQELEKLDVKELICEGEAIVYDSNTNSFLPFQETVKRKRKHNVENMATQMPLQVFLFDLLYHDGKEYLAKTHQERRVALENLFKNSIDSSIKVVEEVFIQTPTQLEDYFIKNISSGLEGLVVKKQDSIYQPGKRNFNWIKLKRQEEGRLDDTLDCIILGYYKGKGKRAKFGIGAFLVGVYNKKNHTVETVAKIGTGLKDNEWVDLKKKCDAIMVSKKPDTVFCVKELFPDVWVVPELICMIRADEITKSPTHTAAKTKNNLGYALRFPRFMGYRQDKSVEDATDNKEVERLYKNQFEK